MKFEPGPAAARFRRRCFFAAALLAATAAPLSAWKVGTHAHLAFIARADALDDGRVTVWLADYDRGRPVLDAGGRPVAIGSYEVDASILEALREYPDHFRTGVVGTDVLPDLLTAQAVVHPDNRGIGRDVSDAWLRLVWTEALRTNSDKALAFATGYLAHGAGDLFGHTLVNEYAGGPFELGPNALKHYVLESYLDGRTPRGDGFFNLSLDGIEPFLHDVLVAHPMIWRPAGDTILEGRAFNASPVRVFSALRTNLQLFVAVARQTVTDADKDFPPRIRSLTRDAAKCAVSDPVRSAQLTAQATALGTEYAALKAAAAAGIAYLNAWIKDIDDGLRAWPAFGRRVAETLFFCPNPDRKAATSAAEDFMNAHGLSMIGLPDALGKTLALNKKFYEMIPKGIRDLIDLFKTDPVLFILMKAWGLTWDLIQNPAVHFDEIMNRPPGTRTTLRAFNRDVLGIRDISSASDETYDWEKIPAMVNTVTLTKLDWLSPAGMAALLRDLEDRGYTSNTPEPLLAPPAYGTRLVLGFLESLDRDNQWCVDPKLLFVRDPCAYRHLFLRQTGEDVPGCLGTCDTPEDGSVVAAPIASPLAPGFDELDMARRTDGAVVRWGKAFIIATAGGPIAKQAFPDPAEVPALPPAAAVLVNSPEDNGVVLGADGSVWTWGFGAHSRAGMWNTPDAMAPLRIPNLESIVQLAGGARHVLALRSNGQVWVWGGNLRGMGVGRDKHPPRPRRIPGLSGVKWVTAGDFFSAAVAVDGSVWTWGANDFAQLGDGTREDRYSPLQVPGIGETATVAAGYAHVLALGRNGAVKAWGKNDQGQIGDGTTQNRPSPVRVPDLPKIVAVAAGGFQSLALDPFGRVWVWGETRLDRTGSDGRAGFSPRPMRLDDLPPIVAVACASNHALVLDKNGDVWTWGVRARTPIRIPGLNLKK
jgi:hypothetical protein